MSLYFCRASARAVSSSLSLAFLRMMCQERFWVGFFVRFWDGWVGVGGGGGLKGKVRGGGLLLGLRGFVCRF